MTAFTAADKLHRLVKHALDSGAAASIAEAEALFAGYRLALRIDEEAARDRASPGSPPDRRRARAARVSGRR